MRNRKLNFASGVLMIVWVLGFRSSLCLAGEGGDFAIGVAELASATAMEIAAPTEKQFVHKANPALDGLEKDHRAMSQVADERYRSRAEIDRAERLGWRDSHWSEAKDILYREEAKAQDVAATKKATYERAYKETLKVIERNPVEKAKLVNLRRLNTALGAGAIVVAVDGTYRALRALSPSRAHAAVTTKDQKDISDGMLMSGSQQSASSSAAKAE